MTLKTPPKIQMSEQQKQRFIDGMYAAILLRKKLKERSPKKQPKSKQKS